MDESAKPATDLSRREFAVASTAAAVLAAGSAHAAQTVSTDVTIKTADGSCDAVLTHPAGKGPWPGVLVWPDAFGVRPAMREMSARLAAQGYAVLTVNQFYRAVKAPVFEGTVDFSDPKVRGRLMDMRAPLTQEAVMRDGQTFVAWLDTQPVVDAKAKAGVVGYCMGGAMTMQTAAASARIGAGCSFHGGGLVTAAPDSPHLLAPKIKAAFYFGVARDDDAKAPQDKVTLKAAFDAAKVPAEVVLYPDGDHGWCAVDSPKFNKAAADRAFDAMVALYKRALV